MKKLSVCLFCPLFCLTLSATAVAQAPDPPLFQRVGTHRPAVSLDAYAKRVGTYRPIAGVQLESVTFTVDSQPVSRQLRKRVQFDSYGDSAAVFCAREVVYLNAMGYRAWISDQHGAGLCQYRFRFGNRIEGQVTVTGVGLANRLELVLVANQSLVRPRAKRQ